MYTSTESGSFRVQLRIQSSDLSILAKSEVYCARFRVESGRKSVVRPKPK